MKIALCSKGSFSLEIGSTKNRIELAEALKNLGWETTLITSEVLGLSKEKKYNHSVYTLALKDYLMKYSSNYDVVLYEYDTLPFERTLFSKTTLFVARPAILAYHLPLTKFRFDLKTKLAVLYKKVKDRLSGKYKDSIAYYKSIDFSLSQCDLIQVQNKKDRALLLTKGFAKEKIIIIPNGISRERMNDFKAYSKEWGPPYTIAFVGTFDYRKGALDLPFLLKRAKGKFPDIKLKLLGTKGLFSTDEEVLNFFPRKYHECIDVVPKFKAVDLPKLLSDCHVGVFPSYLESFGFGALEMMSAGLPVVAYDSPGPSDFILDELLVPTGDRMALTEKVLSLLQNKNLMSQKSSEAQELVNSNYGWDEIAGKADQSYRAALTIKNKE